MQKYGRSFYRSLYFFCFRFRVESYVNEGRQDPEIAIKWRRFNSFHSDSWQHYVHRLLYDASQSSGGWCSAFRRVGSEMCWSGDIEDCVVDYVYWSHVTKLRLKQDKNKTQYNCGIKTRRVLGQSASVPKVTDERIDVSWLLQNDKFYRRRRVWIHMSSTKAKTVEFSARMY
jgi:hypothetical protein